MKQTVSPPNPSPVMSCACATTIRDEPFSVPAPFGKKDIDLLNSELTVLRSVAETFGVSPTGWYGYFAVAVMSEVPSVAIPCRSQPPLELRTTGRLSK